MLEHEKKTKGAFFTLENIASYLVDRVITGTDHSVLEPSYGDGAFVDAIIRHYEREGSSCKVKDNFYGVEIREEAARKYSDHPCIDSRKLILGDYISIEPFPVDVIIGNPPYVGLNKLPQDERERAQHLLDLYRFQMQASGSLWFPFILHSCAFLNRGGAIAFVLPFEITHVKYAKQLWSFLGAHFAELTVIRIFEDIFPDVDVETVLFIARGYGDSTNFINYEIYKDRASLINGRIEKRSTVPVESVLNGDRPFVANLLSPEQLAVIQKLRARGAIMPISRFCKFKIGYVCADKRYFHPSDETIRELRLTDGELIPTVANARVVRRGIGLSIEKNQVKTKLFLPNKGKLTARVLKYVQYGESIGVDRKYKCRQRRPWYVTPGAEIPNIILTVFVDKPRLYINTGEYLASNSLLCGFLQDKRLSPNQLAASWYNTLTLLSIELKVHSLGGGVLVFIPGETDAIEVIDPHALNGGDTRLYSDLDQLLKAGRLEDAYSLGDEYALRQIGLTEQEAALLRDAVQTLRKWRNAKLRKVIHED